jgi:hypothetical protein
MTQHRKSYAVDPDLVLRAISLLRQLASTINESQRTQVKEGFTMNQALMLHHLVSHGDATPVTWPIGCTSLAVASRRRSSALRTWA